MSIYHKCCDNNTNDTNALVCVFIFRVEKKNEWLMMNTENIENDRSDKVTVVIHKTFQSIKTLGLLAVTVVLGSDSDLRD